MVRLVTERLVLREIKEKDSKEIVKNANNIKVSRYLATVPHPYTLKDAAWWINKHKNDFRKKKRETYDLIIELKDTSELIGAIALNKVDKFDKTATMGYWLGEKYWRRGIMSEAVIAILDFAFNKLKLRRINISAYAKNNASNALIKKMGFRYEGMKRKGKKVKSTGKIYDENIYGLLKEDWKKHMNKLKK